MEKSQDAAKSEQKIFRMPPYSTVKTCVMRRKHIDVENNGEIVRETAGAVYDCIADFFERSRQE
jgi:hypothetical protein